MFKVNNKDTRTVNFEHISHLVLVFLLLTLNMQMPAAFTWKVSRLFPNLAFSNVENMNNVQVHIEKFTISTLYFPKMLVVDTSQSDSTEKK